MRDNHKKNDETEADVDRDDAVAGSRATGGLPGKDRPDHASTTGVEESPEFVGRIAGDDVGYAEETGSERRAEAARERD
ncbi:MAG: hypothetical protein JO147_15000 [Actinobacteria bacterium]|nr:hypothetical protein [Actinomycetota bacterium]